MIRPPPRSTRTDTLFPSTTLFRSPRHVPDFPILNLHSDAPRVRVGVLAVVIVNQAAGKRDVNAQFVSVRLARQGLPACRLLEQDRQILLNHAIGDKRRRSVPRATLPRLASHPVPIGPRSHAPLS